MSEIKQDIREKNGRFAKGTKYAIPKGVTRNPKGRPKGTGSIIEAYKNLLDSVDPKDARGRTGAEIIAEAMYKQSKKGNVKSTSEITDRIHGKAVQNINVENKNPLVILQNNADSTPDQKTDASLENT